VKPTHPRGNHAGAKAVNIPNRVRKGEKEQGKGGEVIKKTGIVSFNLNPQSWTGKVIACVKGEDMEKYWEKKHGWRKSACKTPDSRRCKSSAHRALGKTGAPHMRQQLSATRNRSGAKKHAGLG